MKKIISFRFSLILFIIGLMTAIQYNTLNEPNSRDTRDVWEVRQELSREKQLHSELLSEIGQLSETLSKYEDAADQSPEQALVETVEDLRKTAGLTETAGPGIEVSIEPSPEAVALGQNIEGIAPDLLIRFVNEINRFNGLYVSIDGNRIVNTTAIRDINGRTTVNTVPIQTPPFNIKIVANSMEDTETLYNHLLSSPLRDDFYIDDLIVEVSEPTAELAIEAYGKDIDYNLLEEAKE
ncbi:uncharacterized protein YlxW (UPF0749 family) [Planomicrobium koreense]|uniref:Uncharacterized protein YlxW (UPF0749 family) n=1 Tax=Planococcus koreensis TaxID=112331 RepID=A0A7W8CRR9_9BACL|nr:MULTISPECIES: DUF881 domain-containing protein [Planococcus]MBB5178982.1 uncharacterized protein YlxW (UPF0749 family) [Planococcus koreensis]MDN3450151.1 DUF881 domain-containing protein [Planococcus sp. APC 3906]